LASLSFAQGFTLFMLNPLTQPSTFRVAELDALRAMAAINLMLFHFTHVYQVKFGFTTPLGFEFPFGKYGVQLFFMLSGFVNAMTLCRKQQADDFLTSRLIRIVPLFLLVIGLNLFLWSLAPLSQFASYTGWQVLANLTLMPNLLGFDCLEPVTWTLQIELLFYGILIFFFLSGALDQPFRPLMLYLLLCLVGGQVILHLPPDASHTYGGWMIDRISEVMLFKYMPLFAIGIFLYQIKSKADQRIRSLVGILTAATVFHIVDDHGHNPVATMILVAVLSFAAYGKIPLLRMKFFVFLSGISYSLYLLHNNLGCVAMYHLNQLGVPSLFCFAFAMVFSVAAAAVVSHCIERPLSSALRDRWRSLQPWLRTKFSCVLNMRANPAASLPSSSCSQNQGLLQ
jgi:peptidoglycan/LPS O-acetylase OafA/YrhL